MDRPAPPPEAVLIRLVRQAAKVTVAAAAKRAGISTARWTQIEQGYETRDGERKPAWAPPDTLAYMAAAIDLPPDRLEAEGHRPDAAAVLREMRRPGVQSAPALVSTPGDAEPRYSDPALQAIWETPNLSPEIRRAMVGLAIAMREQERAENRSA
jgi:transcriptional regulator with XRE-family HTH domain